jgi:hypothetical protein
MYVNFAGHLQTHIRNFEKEMNEGNACLRLEGFACCDDQTFVILRLKTHDTMSSVQYLGKLLSKYALSFMAFKKQHHGFDLI